MQRVSGAVNEAKRKRFFRLLKKCIILLGVGKKAELFSFRRKNGDEGNEEGWQDCGL